MPHVTLQCLYQHYQQDALLTKRQLAQMDMFLTKATNMGVKGNMFKE